MFFFLCGFELLSSTISFQPDCFSISLGIFERQIVTNELSQSLFKWECLYFCLQFQVIVFLELEILVDIFFFQHILFITPLLLLLFPFYLICCFLLPLLKISLCLPVVFTVMCSDEDLFVFSQLGVYCLPSICNLVFFK